MLLEAIKSHLVFAGVVNTGWDCFIGFCPDSQDSVISLHQTGGYPDETHQGETVKSTFQVRVRSGPLDYAGCQEKWWEMFRALHNADLASQGIRLVLAESSGPLEYYDSKDRPNMTANFVAVWDTPQL